MIAIIISLIQDQTAARVATLDFQTNDFLTLGTLGTLAGSSATVYMVCGTLQSVFNWNPKWLALLLSIIISIFIAIATTSELAAWIKYSIAVLNGFLIFATATGANVMRAAAVIPPGNGGAGRSANQQTINHPIIKVARTFSTSWF